MRVFFLLKSSDKYLDPITVPVDNFTNVFKDSIYTCTFWTIYDLDSQNCDDQRRKLCCKYWSRRCLWL